METEIGRLLDLIGETREKANVNAAFGEPVTVEGRTIVPVAKVAYGFRMGMGRRATPEPKAEEETDQPQDQEVTKQSDGAAGGGGGAMMAHPFAVIEITPEGTRVEPIVNEQKLALAGSLLIGWGILCVARTLVKIFGED